ncbi:MAG: hypothetical protein SCARUB_02954 [Candidatus Scalindua rubra]|uniref:Uncharacterized protein n=1 Tax=Candidatus Scalindua rubra TaxID=1872076 RepID=A0A1E3X8F6_9BACT|nr:MAG: hypothetical protein SCARUB_02954 [Candidatus Scalindua rubra]
MIQYIGVIQVRETMRNKKVCWRFVWSGDAKRLIIAVTTQSVGTSKLCVGMSKNPPYPPLEKGERGGFEGGTKGDLFNSFTIIGKKVL